jgi:CubicO group peptidase (beta-lactamase class C family)
MFLSMVFALGLGGCAWMRPDLAARVATGTTAHDLCSETFVSGQNPDQVFAETEAPRPGLRWIAPLIRYRVDRQHQEVQASLAGAFTSRAVYRGAWGCTLVGPHDTVALDDPPPAPTAPPGADWPFPVTASPALQTALDHAFAEDDPHAPRATKAVLVLYRGNPIAERYAPGYGPQTQILGYSISKSVTNALVGILVRQGKLGVDTPVRLDNGEQAKVTLENLMRMTSGLDLDETGSGFDPSNHVMYLHPADMAAAARKARPLAPPGERWAYSSASVHLIARMVRDATGGDASGVQRFAREQLFRPLGMRHVTMEMDETGTPIGAHYMLASARDWARFGELYLNDGVTPDGRRILPENWVRWSTTPTLDTDYGAGWWVNRSTQMSANPVGDMPLMSDAPPDTFYALGNLGQYVIVVPSKQLVIVRMGNAQTHDFDIDGANRLVADVIAALPGSS